jgi:hypothetical protein
MRRFTVVGVALVGLLGSAMPVARAVTSAQHTCVATGTMHAEPVVQSFGNFGGYRRSFSVTGRCLVGKALDRQVSVFKAVGESPFKSLDPAVVPDWRTVDVQSRVTGVALRRATHRWAKGNLFAYRAYAQRATGEVRVGGGQFVVVPGSGVPDNSCDFGAVHPCYDFVIAVTYEGAIP